VAEPSAGWPGALAGDGPGGVTSQEVRFGKEPLDLATKQRFGHLSAEEGRELDA
jgi:hypothetical protein